MILRHSVVIQSRTASTGTEGEKTFSFATLKTIKADVQPSSMSPEELKAWGIVDTTANVRAMFYARDAAVRTAMRAVVDGETYEIRNINPWNIHDRALLVPVQGL